MATETIQNTEVLKRVENLLTAIEIYRDVEQQAINRIKEILYEKGIEISAEEIKDMDKERIRERLRATKYERERKEKVDSERVAEESGYETKQKEEREEERTCRR